jgi:hypothetical protein
MIPMDRNTLILLVAGVLVTLVVITINIYVAGMVFIVVLAIAMVMAIMQDSSSLPANIIIELSEDAKTAIIRNTGSAPAEKIHVALVPANIEFDIPSLGPDESGEHDLGTMVGNVKAIIRFEDGKGNTYSRTVMLSASGGPYDPFKPAFPLFSWK